MYIHYALGFTIFCNSFLVSGDFSRLLITFANSLDPGQYRQNVGPDLDTDRLPLWKWSWKCFFFFTFFFLKKANFEKSAGDKKFWNYPACRVNCTWAYLNHSRCYMRILRIIIRYVRFVLKYPYEKRRTKKKEKKYNLKNMLVRDSNPHICILGKAKYSLDYQGFVCPFFTLTKKTNTVCMLARFNVSKWAAWHGRTL